VVVFVCTVMKECPPYCRVH